MRTLSLWKQPQTRIPNTIYLLLSSQLQMGQPHSPYINHKPKEQHQPNTPLMGSSLSCFCPELASNKTQVLVVTQNGELLKFTQGTRVKDVVISYPDHKVIPCQSSDRWALPDACQLSSRRLYFLVLEEAVADDAVFESLVWAAVARGLMVVPEGVNKCGHRRRPLPLAESGCSGFDSGGEMVVLGQVLGLEDFGFKKLPWKPILQTIPEVISPPFLADVFK